MRGICTAGNVAESSTAPSLPQTRSSALHYQNICHFVFNAEITLVYKMHLSDVLKSLSTSQNLLEGNQCEEQTSCLTKTPSKCVKIIFPFKDEYFSAEVAVSLAESVSPREGGTIGSSSCKC